MPLSQVVERVARGIWGSRAALATLRGWREELKGWGFKRAGSCRVGGSFKLVQLGSLGPEEPRGFDMHHSSMVIGVEETWKLAWGFDL